MQNNTSFLLLSHLQTPTFFSAMLASGPHQTNASVAAASLPIIYQQPTASVTQQQHHFIHPQQLQPPAQQPEPEPPGTSSTTPSRNDILILKYRIRNISCLESARWQSAARHAQWTKMVIFALPRISWQCYELEQIFGHFVQQGGTTRKYKNKNTVGMEPH